MSEEMGRIEKVRTHMMLHGSQHRFPLETCCAIVSVHATESYWREQITREVEALTRWSPLENPFDDLMRGEEYGDFLNRGDVLAVIARGTK